jgi:hypothetical protein
VVAGKEEPKAWSGGKESMEEELQQRPLQLSMRAWKGASERRRWPVKIREYGSFILS